MSFSSQMGISNPGMSSRPQNPKRIGGYETGQLQQFTPEQMQLFQSLFGNLGPDSYLSRLAGGEQGLFDEMEAPAKRQFSGLLGGLGSRFSGMGQGGRHSSGFQNTATQASSDFAQGLQSQRQNLQRQALMDLMGMSNQLLGQRPYENFLVPEKPAWWETALQLMTGMGNRAMGAASHASF